MIGFAEKSLDTEQDSSDLQCRTPLFCKKVKLLWAILD